MAAGLERFVTAQAPIYQQVLGELRAGTKRSHWMWFVFPQIAGLGRSPTAQFYAIRDLTEAREYLEDETLGPRLRECTDTVIGWTGRKSAEAIFGPVDAVKFCSSMTLFEAAGGSEPFSQALDGFYGGGRDAATLEKIGV